MEKNRSIAVFDSGLGGLSVLKRLLEIMPSENYLYFGDSKNAPYGQKSQSEIQNLCSSVTEELLREELKCIVIACNTATSAALAYLEKKFPDIKFIGIEPAVREAAETLENPFVLTIATNFTIHGERYQKSVAGLSDKGSFSGIGAPGLVTAVESGITDRNPTEECREYIKNVLMSAAKERRPDAIVLGCTHFPFLEDTIQKCAAEVFGKKPEMFDAAKVTAKNTFDYLNENGNLAEAGKRGTVELRNSDPSKLEMMRKLYESF